MKIKIFSDLHNNFDNLDKIKSKIVIGGHHHKLSKREFIINNIKYLAAGMKGEFIEVEI